MRLGKRDAAYVGSLARNCEGAVDPNRYVLTVKCRVIATSSLFGEEAGLPALDETNAFDLAEARGTYVGQLNLIQVSSFCGPQGLIWGYDLAVHDRLREFPLGQTADVRDRVIPVYDARMLESATRALFGTVDAARFPIAPGSLCAAAYKSFTCSNKSGHPAKLFAVLGLGIAEERERHACILMEDVGILDPRLSAKDVRLRTALSVASVAGNQRVRCREIFVAYDEAVVQPDEVGCALVAAPYVRLARQAMPLGGLRRLRDMTLTEWEDSMVKR